MEGEECGRGKRVKRVIVCRNGWHNCCLPAFQKGGGGGGGGGGCRATSTKSSSSPPKPKAGSSNKATVAEDTIPLMPVAADTKGSQTGSPIQPQPQPETETSTEAETSTTVVALRTSSSSEPSEEEEDEEEDKYDTKLCEECGRGDGEQEMLLCDGCDRGFHMFCLCPILVTVPLGDWFCPHCSHSARVQEFPKVQKKIVDFFRIQKPSPFAPVIKDMEARKRKRPSGGALCRQKKSRRLLAYVPCTDHERKIEQMASLATALTSIGVAFNDSLAYGLAPRSANRAVNEKGGMQMMGKEDKATLDACKAMCSQGEWPPLMVTHDRRQGFVVEADRNIKDMTIIAEYTGEVDYMYRRQHDAGNSIMGLLFSDDPSKELVICPDRQGNIARFVSGINNHSPEGRKKQNVRCVRFNIDGEARVILVAIRDIPKGERLYYDYNAYQTEYPTQHFV